MANSNAPFGFRPARHVNGTGHIVGRYKIASGLAENIAIGDLVKSDGNGGIQKAGVTDAMLGIFAGYSLSTQGTGVANYQGSATGDIPWKKYWVSGTTVATGMTAYALVHDNPEETFIVQTSGTLTEADVGAFVNMVDATPDSTFGVSRQTVGPSSGKVQFRVERIIEEPIRLVDANNNTAGFGLSSTGQYARVEVKPVKHERGGSAMAVEV